MTTQEQTDVAAHLAAGRLARSQGNLAEAIRCYREAIRLQPEFVPTYNNLANALQAKGDFESALAAIRQALVMEPDKAALHCTLGSLLWLQDQPQAAIAAYERAVALQPELFLAHYNLAKAFAAMGDFRRAEASYRTALCLKPEQADIHLELGQLYQRYGFMPRAVAHYKASLRLKPSAAAYNALGAALQDLGVLKLAAQSYRRALKLQPDFDLPQYNLAQLHESLGDLASASRYYQQALAHAPADAPTYAKLHLLLATLRRKQADWQDDPARLATLRAAIAQQLDKDQAAILPLLSALAFDLPPAWLRTLAAQQARYHARLAEALHTPFDYPTDPQPARLRIGYLSPDFRCHAVGTLVAGLFQHHQRPEFEIFAYSLVPAHDDWTAQIRQGVDHFVDVSQQPALAIARRIHADGIHILIDLAGYTTHSQPLVLALRPAPLQVQWLGYPGTLGADFVPYLLADAQLIPPEQSAHYSEEIIHLPHAWGTTPWTTDAVPPRRADCGLPAQGVVYCCFNSIHKIDLRVFSGWMEILQQVPDSVLWLLDGGASGSNAALRQRAQAAGIDPARLVFADKRAHAEYLARYQLADLFLDTPAYNAGATAVGALAMGLPLITCPGEHYASRMGASLCHAIGLPELICTSQQAYVEQAVALGRDAERLADLKARLQQRREHSPLFQPQAFVASLEAAYRALWQRHTCPSQGAATQGVRP